MSGKKLLFNRGSLAETIVHLLSRPIYADSGQVRGLSFVGEAVHAYMGKVRSGRGGIAVLT